MSNKDDKALPFFSRFLEGQFCQDLSEEEMNEITGGLKLAPQSPDEIVTTLKFPSDLEDGQPVHPPVSKKPVDLPVTKKYPSDREDVVVTQKYPSDNDDWLATTPIPKDSIE